MDAGETQRLRLAPALHDEDRLPLPGKEEEERPRAAPRRRRVAAEVRQVRPGPDQHGGEALLVHQRAQAFQALRVFVVRDRGGRDHLVLASGYSRTRALWIISALL